MYGYRFGKQSEKEDKGDKERSGSIRGRVCARLRVRR